MTPEQALAPSLDDAINRAVVDEVRALLDAGASPNLADVAGDTPLMSAARVGAPEIVGLLLERGALVNARGRDGRNALQRVSTITNHRHAGHDQSVLFLREAGSEE